MNSWECDVCSPTPLGSRLHIQTTNEYNGKMRSWNPNITRKWLDETYPTNRSISSHVYKPVSCECRWNVSPFLVCSIWVGVNSVSVRYCIWPNSGRNDTMVRHITVVTGSHLPLTLMNSFVFAVSNWSLLTAGKNIFAICHWLLV